jgi:hypothetical protein
MDFGNFTGLTIFGLLAAVVYAMCSLALKFFATDSVKVRLLIFFILFFGLAVPITVVAMRSEIFNAPVPPKTSAAPAPSAPGTANPGATPSKPASGAAFSMVGLAYAQDADRWIFCGTLSATGRFESSAVATSTDTEHSIVGQTRHLRETVTIYDREPTFSVTTFRWVLGQQSGSLAANTEVRVGTTRVMGQRRIWCKLAG